MIGYGALLVLLGSLVIKFASQWVWLEGGEYTAPPSSWQATYLISLVFVCFFSNCCPYGSLVGKKLEMKMFLAAIQMFYLHTHECVCVCDYV